MTVRITTESLALTMFLVCFTAGILPDFDPCGIWLTWSGKSFQSFISKVVNWIDLILSVSVPFVVFSEQKVKRTVPVLFIYSKTGGRTCCTRPREPRNGFHEEWDVFRQSILQSIVCRGQRRHSHESRGDAPDKDRSISVQQHNRNVWGTYNFSHTQI